MAITSPQNPNLEKDVTLRAGNLRVALAPHLGGAVAGFWCGEHAAMRSVEPAVLQGPRQGANFPLVPYSNRLADRRFTWRAREFSTTANFDHSPHSVHGSAWTRAWEVMHHDGTTAELRYLQTPDAHWPYAFDVTQRIELDARGLRQTLHVTNTDSRAQPMGLGWHPYFPKRSRSRIHVDCAGQWLSDATTQLPTQRIPSHGVDADVRHLDLDHCFDGWTGKARIRDEHLTMTLSSSLDRVVIFTPPLREHFCVEPVSHVSDAVHATDWAARGLKELAPGHTMTAWMRLDVEATHT
jgi:aldose 1-epimerase